jgi:hypothetical protein
MKTRRRFGKELKRKDQRRWPRKGRAECESRKRNGRKQTTGCTAFVENDMNPR